MALINCPDCGKQVSDKAPNCIHCGCPIAQPSEPEKKVSEKKTKIEITGAAELKDKIGRTIQKLGAKKLVIIAAVVVAVIVGIVAISGMSDGMQMLAADEIKLNEVHEIKDIGEFEIIRVSTSNHLLTDDAGDKTHVIFDCYFTNKTGEAYNVSELATVSAKSKETGAVYTNCEVGSPGRSVILNVSADPNVKTRVSFALETPPDETELVVTIAFGEESFNFDYTVGDLIRNNQSINAGDTIEVEDVASIEITDIAYSSGVWAPKAYRGNTHNGYAVDDANETAFLILDTAYTNLMHYNKAPSYLREGPVKIEVVYENKYYYTDNTFYTFYMDNEWMREAYDGQYIPKAEVRTCMIVEVPKRMIEQAVEINVFVGDKEFTYNGTPRYVDKYGMNKYS